MTDSETSPPPRLNLVVIRAADVEASREFYGSLGLKLEPEQHGSGPRQFAATSGDVVFEIYPLAANAERAQQRSATVRIGFAVASLGPLLKQLKQAGVSVVSAPKSSPWGTRAVVADPDGNRVELVENR